jgi:hypothetical protein
MDGDEGAGRFTAADLLNRRDFVAGIDRFRALEIGLEHAYRAQPVGNRNVVPFGPRRALGDQAALVGDPRIGNVQVFEAFGKNGHHRPHFDALRAKRLIGTLRRIDPLQLDSGAARGFRHHSHAEAVYAAVAGRGGRQGVAARADAVGSAGIDTVEPYRGCERGEYRDSSRDQPAPPGKRADHFATLLIGWERGSL